MFAGQQAPKKTEEHKKCFVDFDGDGFDDNALDDDLDGIPNEVDPDYVKPVADTGAQVGARADTQQDDFFAMDDMVPVPVLDLLSNAQKFCRLRMSVRSLAQSRGAFDESNEFGVGEGIGAGAVVGGVCQGGVCVPH